MKYVLLLSTLALSLAFGCGKKSDDQPASDQNQPEAKTPEAKKPEQPEAKKPEQPAAKNPEAKKPGRLKKPEPTISEEARKAYLTHLRAGRKLTKKERWGEATAEFEKALEAIPMDGRALSEIGWSAFKAGDLAKAKKANSDSVRVSSNPKLKAASLYNLGRVTEAQNDPETATKYYQASLELRPHKAVQARLAKLGKKPKPPTAQPSFKSPCQANFDTAQAACECLSKHADIQDDDAASGECTVEQTSDSRLAVAEVVLSADTNEYQQYLLASHDEGWSAIADLGYVYEGGVGGVYNELAVSRLDIKQVGGKDVWWVEATEQGSDSDMGINEYESHENTTLHLCVMDDSRAPTCKLTLPLRHSYIRDYVDPDYKLADDVKDLATSDLPLESSYTMRVTLADDGTATLILDKGSAPETARALLGPHKLW